MLDNEALKRLSEVTTISAEEAVERLADMAIKTNTSLDSVVGSLILKVQLGGDLNERKTWLSTDG